MKIYAAAYCAAAFNPSAADWMAEVRDNGHVSIDFGDERGMRVFDPQDAIDYCRAEAILLDAFSAYDNIAISPISMRDPAQN